MTDHIGELIRTVPHAGNVIICHHGWFDDDFHRPVRTVSHQDLAFWSMGGGGTARHFIIFYQKVAGDAAQTGIPLRTGHFPAMHKAQPAGLGRFPFIRCEHSGMSAHRSHEFLRGIFHLHFSRAFIIMLAPTLALGLASGLAVILHLTWPFIGPFQPFFPLLRTCEKLGACGEVLLTVPRRSGSVSEVHIGTNRLSQLLPGQAEAVGREPASCALGEAEAGEEVELLKGIQCETDLFPGERGKMLPDFRILAMGGF